MIVVRLMRVKGVQYVWWWCANNESGDGYLMTKSGAASGRNRELYQARAVETRANIMHSWNSKFLARRASQHRKPFAVSFDRRFRK